MNDQTTASVLELTLIIPLSGSEEEMKEDIITSGLERAWHTVRALHKWLLAL